MTRKDHEKIARVLNGGTVMYPPEGFHFGKTVCETFMDGCRDQRRIICDYMADMLAQDNPRFDRARFLKACDIE
jgi:hypothetical protein